MATLNRSNAADLDDAHERDDTTVVTDTNELICSDFGSFTNMSLIRFPNVTIPRNSKINTCTMSVRHQGGGGDDPDLLISCEDTDDCAAAVETDGNISGRTKTSGSVAWTATNLGTGVVNSPDFAAELQKVIDRPGFVSGNAIGVLMHTPINGSDQNLEPYNLNSGTGDEPILNVDYTAVVILRRRIEGY